MSISPYLRFLELLQTIDGQGGTNALDLDAKKLLEVILVSDSRGETLTVLEAMQLSHIASPATIHRKLDILREMGLISTDFVGDNRRTKYLKPTPAAFKHFDQLGKILSKSLKPV